MSDDITYDPADDGDLVSLSGGPSATQLKQVSELAAQQLRCERKVFECEQDLKHAQEDLRNVAERDLPGLMADCGLSEFRLTNGAKITVKRKIVGFISQENRANAFAWLYRNGYGPIVKRNVEVQFVRGEAEKAVALLDYLKEEFGEFKVSDKEAVHGGTLNAWARELTERNEAAFKEGGHVVELPDEIKITELRASVVVLPT